MCCFYWKLQTTICLHQNGETHGNNLSTPSWKKTLFSWKQMCFSWNITFYLPIYLSLLGHELQRD